jgi:hypothetical protein
MSSRDETHAHEECELVYKIVYSAVDEKPGVRGNSLK